MSNLLRWLRGWIGMIGIIALGNRVSCFTDHSDDDFCYKRVQTPGMSPPRAGAWTYCLFTPDHSKVNGLAARLFGAWTLLAASLRIYCAVDIKNVQLYNLTLFSFIVVIAHFLMEALVYKTAPITFGVIAPLVVAGLSVIFMLIGYQFLEEGRTDSKELDKHRGLTMKAFANRTKAHKS